MIFFNIKPHILSVEGVPSNYKSQNTSLFNFTSYTFKRGI